MDDDVRQALQGLDAKIDGVDAKVDALDAKIDGVEKRLDAKIDGVDAKIDGVEQRLSRAIYSEISRALGVIEERFTTLFGLLDEKYGQKIAELREDLDSHRNDTEIHLPRD